MKEGLRQYNLKKLEQHNADLEKMGVRLFVFESWELFVYILQNYERFCISNKHAQPWFSFCQAGEWRSKYFNVFLKEIGIPLGKKKRTREDENEDGSGFPILLSTLAGGKVQDGLLLPSNFREGFKNIIIFVSSRELLANNTQKLITKSLQTLIEDEPEYDLHGVNIFIVTEDETELSGMSKIALDLLAAGGNDQDSRESVAEKLQEKYSKVVDVQWGNFKDELESV